MNDKEIAGVKVFVSNETYDEYKGTLQEQINNLQSKIDNNVECIRKISFEKDNLNKKINKAINKLENYNHIGFSCNIPIQEIIDILKD